jgi:hypothetical protein
MGSQKRNSTVKPKTLCPVWNEQFTFVVSNVRDDALLIKVRDRDTFGADESLGFTFVRVGTLVPGKATILQLALQEIECGEILLTATYNPSEESRPPATSNAERLNLTAIEEATHLPAPYELLGGEEMVTSPLQVSVGADKIAAVLTMTNYRVVLTGEDAEPVVADIPVATIHNVTIDSLTIVLVCKDVRDVVVRVRDDVPQAKDRCQRLYHTILRAIFSNGKYFAFVHRLNSFRPRAPTVAAAPAVAAAPPAAAAAEAEKKAATEDEEKGAAEVPTDAATTTSTAATPPSPTTTTTTPAPPPPPPTSSTPKKVTISEQPVVMVPSSSSSFSSSSSAADPSAPASVGPPVAIGWMVYHPLDELRRMGLPGAGWRLTEVNYKYDFTPSYPSILCVPSAVTDKQLIAVRAFRSKGRIPTLCWRSPCVPSTGAVMLRCSQPLVGLMRSRCKEDEALIQAARTLTAAGSTFYIVDCRPIANAVGNAAMGKGWESASNYEGCAVVFMNIANIHVMRRSLDRLKAAIYASADGGETSDLGWGEMVAASGWLLHLRALLRAAKAVVSYIEVEASSVLVHCSDGWDRTSQITGLAQLLLDPHYRTVEGFFVLVEKEFLSFGHKFADRCGHGGSLRNEQETSPVFVQFLDAVFQITRQFPHAFEFNEALLLALADGVYSCRFGTFLFNCDRERAAAGLPRVAESLWSFIIMNIDRYRNMGYQQVAGVLVPSLELRTLEVWRGLYFRHAPHLAPRVLLSSHQKVDQWALNSLRNSARFTVSEDGRFGINTSTALATADDAAAAGEEDGDDDDDDDNIVAEEEQEFVMIKAGVRAERALSDDDSSGELEGLADEAAKARRPEWIRNNKSKECFGCCRRFTIFKRRHHCRNCGLLFCSSCCSSRTPILSMGYQKPVRVCNNCRIDLSILNNGNQAKQL